MAINYEEKKKEFLGAKRKAKKKTLIILLPILIAAIISCFVSPIFLVAIIPTFFLAVFCTWYYILIRARIFGTFCEEGNYLVLTAGEGGEVVDIIMNKRGEALNDKWERVLDSDPGARKRWKFKGAYFFNSLFVEIETTLFRWKKISVDNNGNVQIIEREEFFIERSLVDYPHGIPVKKVETADRGKVDFALSIVFYIIDPYKAEKNIKTRWIIIGEQHAEKASIAWAKQFTVPELFSKSFSEISELLEKYMEDHGHAKILREKYGIAIRNILFLSLEESDKELVMANRRKVLAELNFQAAQKEGEIQAVLNSEDISGSADHMLAKEMGITVDDLQKKKNEDPEFVEKIRSRLDHLMGVAQRNLANKRDNYFDLNTGNGGNRGNLNGRVFQAAVEANIATRISGPNKTTQPPQKEETQEEARAEKRKKLGFRH